MVFIDFFHVLFSSTLVFPSFFHSGAVPLTSPGRAGCWVASSKPVPAVQAVPAAWRTWGITGRFIVINQHQKIWSIWFTIIIYYHLLSSIIIYYHYYILLCICMMLLESCLLLLLLNCIKIDGGWSIFFAQKLCEIKYDPTIRLRYFVRTPRLSRDCGATMSLMKTRSIPARIS